jgi:hypothetical protein
MHYHYGLYSISGRHYSRSPSYGVMCAHHGVAQSDRPYVRAVASASHLTVSNGDVRCQRSFALHGRLSREMG